MSGATRDHPAGLHRLARLPRSLGRRLARPLSRCAAPATPPDDRPHDPRHRRRSLPAHRPLCPGRLQPQHVPAALPGRHGRHVHDDLRHHGHRPQHRGRVRGSARPRVRRLLRDRRLHGGVPRVAPLRGARHQPDVPRQRRAGRRRDPPAVLDHRRRRGHRGGDIRSAARAHRPSGSAATTWPS